MTYLKLYIFILQLSFMSLGGIYSFWAIFKNEAVQKCESEIKKEQLKVCEQDFNLVLGISELLPGPKVNAVALLGYRSFKITGMLVLVIAMITPGLILIPIVMKVEKRFTDNKSIRYFLRGAAIGVISILLLFLFGLTQAFFEDLSIKSIYALLVILAVFILSKRYKVHPLLLVPAGATIGYFCL